MCYLIKKNGITGTAETFVEFTEVYFDHDETEKELTTSTAFAVNGYGIQPK